MRRNVPEPGNQADHVTALIDMINNQGDAGEVEEIKEEAARQEGERSKRRS